MAETTPKWSTAQTTDARRKARLGTWLYTPLLLVLSASSPSAAGLDLSAASASVDTVRLESVAPDTTAIATADTVAIAPGDWRRGARTGFKIGLGIGILSLLVVGATSGFIVPGALEDIPPEAFILVPLLGGTAIGAMVTRHDRPAETDSRARR